MDTSDIYIKMSDCKEIQSGHEFKVADWVFYNDGAGVVNVFTLDSCTLGDWDIEGMCQIDRELHAEVMGGTMQYRKEGKYPLLVGAYLWLPRQDQIQDMYGDKDSVWFMHHRGEYIVEDKLEGKEPVRVPGVFGSMDQAWMAWYMFKKHRKTWDGKTWKA